MDSILEMLQSRLTGDEGARLGERLGTDPSTAQQAVQAALPAIVAALAGNARRPEGAANLSRALEEDHDGSVLDDLSGFLARGDTSDGDAILGHALGQRRPAVEAEVAKSTGLDMSTIARLLPILAPIVMGALGRQKRQADLDPGGLAGMLAGEQGKAQEMAPEGLGGLLGGLLDQEGDGLDLGDIADAAGKLGGLLNRRG